MLALISPAKIMHQNASTLSNIASEPRFLDHSNAIASQMLSYSVEDIQEIFKISPAIARELYARFRNFFDELTPRIAAVECYDGVVYKHFKDSITALNAPYLQSTVRISSLLYGLLRPFDLVKPYRMEGFVRLTGSDQRIDRFWRNIQTSLLIDEVKEAGGTLLYLASKEEQNAFNWREVTRSVQVIDIEFLQHHRGKLRQIVIYTKMARGEMLRYMLKNQLTDPESLKSFEWQGYSYSAEHSTATKWAFVLND